MEVPLELQLKQATVLKNVLEEPSDIFSMANLGFSSNGCVIHAVDTGGVGFVAFLRAEAFDRYRCDHDLSMGLNLAAMAEVVRCADDDDTITIKFEEDWSDSLALKFKSSKNGEISVFYFDVDIDIDAVPLQTEESEYQAKVRLPSAQFMNICKKLSSFGDREDMDTVQGIPSPAVVVTISVDKEGVSFLARGKNGTSRIVCRQTPTVGKPKEPNLIEMMKEEVSLKCGLRYIRSFSKVSTVSDQVTISLSSKEPAVFKCEIAGMGNIRYMLPVNEAEMQNEGDELQRFTFPLELQLKQATLLKNVLEAISDMFTKANFNISSKGCKLQAVNTSGVALVAFLRAKAFNDYVCCHDLSMGLNLTDMAEVFRCANDEDIITIKPKDGSNALAFTFESSQDGEVSQFYFNIVGIDIEPRQTEETLESEYQAKVRLPSAQFMNICKKLSSFGDHEDTDTVVTISVDKEGLSFFAQGKNGTSRVVCRQTPTVCKPQDPTLIEMKEEVSLKFSMRYIKSFSKMSTLSDQVTISLSSKKPAVFEYKIAETGDIRYYMLPVDEGNMQNKG